MRISQASMHGAALTHGPLPWVESAARIGYLTKGCLYFVIGALALMTAIGAGGAVTDGEEAVRTIGDRPFGQVLLGLMAFGLFAYALWRFVQAALDPEHKGTDPAGLVARISWAISGVVHASLGVAALQMLLGSASSGSEKRAWIGALMRHDAGRVALALVGVIVVGAGVQQIYCAFKEQVREQLKLSEMSARAQRWTLTIAKAGLIARGVVFAIVGVGLIKSSTGASSSKEPSVEGALLTLSQQTYGDVLLGVVALGLACYGAHMVLSARYRKIPS